MEGKKKGILAGSSSDGLKSAMEGHECSLWWLKSWSWSLSERESRKAAYRITGMMSKAQDTATREDMVLATGILKVRSRSCWWMPLARK